jgi:Transposase IS200 like
MSRKLRIEYPGAMYHVMNWGDQREDIFRDDEDRQRFLCTLSEACGKTDWQVHAYCLMRNHGGNYGAQRQESDRQKAERVVKEELGRLGWEEDDLGARRKGHRAKVMLARRLRQETTMSLKWIAQRLQMGSWTYVSNLLNEPPQPQPQAQEELLLCQ